MSRFGRCVFNLLIGICLIALSSSVAIAQDSASDAVKKAVDSAVSNAVANTLQQTLRTSLTEPSLAPSLYVGNFTAYTRPEFLWITTKFGNSRSTTPIFIAPVGGVYRLTQDIFLSGTGTFVNVGNVSGTHGGHIWDGNFTATYVAFNDGMTNIRATGGFEANESTFGAGASQNRSSSYSPNLSVDFEHAFGPLIATITPGFAWTWNDPKAPKQPSTAFNLTGKAAYIIGNWQPQFTVAWQKQLDPSDPTSQISFTPEIDYIYQNLTFGVAYQYLTVLNEPSGVSTHGNAVIANLRARF